MLTFLLVVSFVGLFCSLIHEAANPPRMFNL